MCAHYLRPTLDGQLRYPLPVRSGRDAAAVRT